MAAALTSQRFLPLSRPKSSNPKPNFASSRTFFRGGMRRDLVVSSVSAQDQSNDAIDKQDSAVPVVLGIEADERGLSLEVVGDAGFSASSLPLSMEGGEGPTMVDRTINATIVLAAGTFAVTKLLTIDMDYWHILLGKTFLFFTLLPLGRQTLDRIETAHLVTKNELQLLEGWTIFEILRYAPMHNWIAYEEALKTNPVLAKMMISGVVYSVGDWIAQCYEGKPLFDFDRTRMLRSGLVGFALHGSLSHYYYQFCETLFPFKDWWVVPVKVAFDQTAWSALWNSIYFVVLGFLRFESPASISKELRATFWPMLTAGWKLWPFAHLITYGVIPIEQRLLWVDCVELIWVTILSTYSNEKSEARISEALAEPNTKPPSADSER